MLLASLLSLLHSEVFGISDNPTLSHSYSHTAYVKHHVIIAFHCDMKTCLGSPDLPSPTPWPCPINLGRSGHTRLTQYHQY